MSFLQIGMLAAMPLILLPVIIHLINQWRYQTKQWGAMMFLLKANKMARGYAKLRQWLILAARMLVIAGLIVAVARPLSSGLLGWFNGGGSDTTILLLDRSPSMQQAGRGGQSKLDTGRRQLAGALSTLGSTHWVLIDSVTKKAQSFQSPEAMVDSPAAGPASGTADIVGMLQSTIDYLKNNQPGATEIWLCSDLRAADWQPESGRWAAIRDAFAQMPQSVRFHLLTYPEQGESDASIRVTKAERSTTGENAVLLSLRIALAGDNPPAGSMPVRIEIDGATTELSVDLEGQQVEVKDYRVPLAGNQESGWGKVSIPADANLADNEAYFVFDDPPPRRIVLVTDDRDSSMALEIAASVSPDGKSESTVEVLAPESLDSLILDDASVLIWQADLPTGETAPTVQHYVDGGGQVIFFPPDSLSGGLNSEGDFYGVSWDSWVSDQKAMVENWRGDQDLLAATESGAGLPVGQLEILSHATIQGDATPLATLSGGDPLLSRVPSENGGVYFCTATASNRQSTFASNGIVLYVLVQRAIENGLRSLGETGNRIAGERDGLSESEADESAGQGSADDNESGDDSESGQWRQLAGADEILSSEYTHHAGIYRTGSEADQQVIAINRSTREDQRDTLTDAQLAGLFEGLDYSRVDDTAGGLEGIVQEIWRLFLILMIGAMLLEALLCVPRRRISLTKSGTASGFNRGATSQDGGGANNRSEAA